MQKPTTEYGETQLRIVDSKARVCQLQRELGFEIQRCAELQKAAENLAEEEAKSPDAEAKHSALIDRLVNLKGNFV